MDLGNAISGFFGAFAFAVAFSFKFSSSISFIVKEASQKSKHQQIVSGMSIVAYWLGNYLYDLTIYMVLVIYSIFLMVGLKVDSLSQGTALEASTLLFIFYGLSYIPFTYICARFFTNYGSAQSSFYFFTFTMSGLIPNIILVLRFIGSDMATLGKKLAWFLRLIPAYSFGEALVNMGSISLLSAIQNDGVTFDVFEKEVALAPITYLFYEIFLNILGLYLLERATSSQRFMRYLTSENKITDTLPATDPDVIDEQQIAASARPGEFQILTRNLRKVFKSGGQRYKVAVDNISLAIPKGEVFGLLGVNGAGKTTTFKMLAGELTSTSGDCYFSGNNISTNLSLIRENLGYCPQFDAIVPQLSVREQLQLFYDLKSLPRSMKKQVIDKKITEMDLESYEHKISGNLSGGNKRKLSVAIAMLGNPAIIFLDEPSTGMDPKARRFMWRVISNISSHSKTSTIILTTHAMQQAQALSTRLAIMVAGNFMCIGPPQHIKSVYGQGFEIQVKLETIPRDKLQELANEEENDIRSNGDTVYSQIDSLGSMKSMSSRTGKISKLQEERRLNGKSRSKLGRDSGSDPKMRLRSRIRNKVGKLFGKNRKSGLTVAQIMAKTEMHIIEKRIAKLKEWINVKIGKTQILEHYDTFIRFKTKSSIKIGLIFHYFEKYKEILYISQYSVRQATLEQIFNRFAEGYEEEES